MNKRRILNGKRRRRSSLKSKDHDLKVLDKSSKVSKVVKPFAKGVVPKVAGKALGIYSAILSPTSTGTSLHEGMNQLRLEEEIKRRRDAEYEHQRNMMTNPEYREKYNIKKEKEKKDFKDRPKKVKEIITK